MTTPWLVADIGGTNARFGLVTEAGGQPEAIAVLAGKEHAGLPEAVAAYLADHAGGVRPGAACIAIAGPIDGDRYRLTNAGWSGSVRDLGIAHVELLNDFEALAASLPHLAAGDLVSLGGPEPAHGVKAVLGPGTGLGVAGLVPVAEGWMPVPCEGGHVTVPVLDERDHEVVRALRAEGMDHVVAEHLLSGPGLTRLHHALALVHGVSAPDLPAAEIVARLDDSLCAEAVDVFCGLLGTFAGNVALTMGARGGVYLGGGVLPRIVERVRASDFRRRFEATPTLGDYLSAIATVLIVAPQPALTGAAAWLNQRLTTTSNLEYA
ncbi:glucokinase [Planomonospora venezuelensis]|uniref:Glucokinase n=1 Tax=Planomonospora venezuelensis TaxID=1999 RepID=A0A841D7Z6_PLAVE|nr:glucokinase [Planomonospora venezuelensis]MBB5966341.1 glucokinase [Planomonospora venezuelensis]GIM99748.1 glucokinase [Planomonospora venezuelensis]